MHRHDQDQGLEEEVVEGKQLLRVLRLSWKRKQLLREKLWQQLLKEKLWQELVKEKP